MTPSFILLGPPGAGKGTQAKRISEHLNANHLSSGDLLRAAAAGGGELGEQINAFLSAGHLVPTALLLPLLENEVSRTPEEQPVVFDGFPRSREQAVILDEMLERQQRPVEAAILIEVPQEELYERLLSRGREDDQPEVIKERLSIYETEIAPLREYYEEQGLLRPVDGTGTPEEVTERILTTIKGSSS